MSQLSAVGEQSPQAAEEFKLYRINERSWEAKILNREVRKDVAKDAKELLKNILSLRSSRLLGDLCG